VRKIISLILLAVFLFNLEGHYVLYHIQQLNIQKNVKAEVQRRLDDENLTLIIVPTRNISQIHWLRKGIEFIYNGNLFDIVRTKTVEGYKYYYCIDDVKEKQLIADYQKKCNQKNQSKKPVLTASNNVFMLSGFSIIIPQPIYLRGSHNSVFNLNSRITDILSPPPKQVSLS
jgi:hypothetical protein